MARIALYYARVSNRGLKQKTLLDLDSDPDLKSLHGNPQFDEIIADAKQRTGAVQKTK